MQVLCICRSPAAQAGRRRRNSLWSCAMPVGSRNFVPRPLAVEPPTVGKNMRALRPHTPRQVRVTCTSANRVCRLLRSWCRCVASAAIQLRKLVVRSTKSPAGAVQSAQWRELDLSSSRAPAKSPAVSEVPVGSRNFVPRPLAVEPPPGKEHEGCAPSYSAAGESYLHPGKSSLPYL